MHAQRPRHGSTPGMPRLPKHGGTTGQWVIHDNLNTAELQINVMHEDPNTAGVQVNIMHDNLNTARLAP